MPDQPTAVPYGYCHCGCGEIAPLAKETRPSRGLVKGQPQRFVRYHHKRRRLKWVAEDRGYLTPCHIWQGVLDRDGRGRWHRDGKDCRAARLVWIDAHGPIADGLVVCHKCDVPACVNLDHLFLGTQADNMADMRAKGRHARGERHGMAKLTEAEAAAIRSAPGTARELAARYGVSRSLVSMIRSGARWGLD